MSIPHPPFPFRRAGQRYAFVVVAVIFLSLLVYATMRDTRRESAMHRHE